MIKPKNYYYYYLFEKMSVYFEQICMILIILVFDDSNYDQFCLGMPIININ